MFEAATRGLDRPRERWALAASLALCVLYGAALAVAQRASTRVDDVFFARRWEVRLQQLAGHPLPLGQPVPASTWGEVAPQLGLLEGWSSAEAWGVWTVGRHAAVAVALPGARPTAAALQLWGAIMAAPGHPQQIGLTLAGRPAGSWAVTSPQATFCVALPPEATQESGVLQVGVEVGSPQRAPGGMDQRALGLGLQGVELLADVSGCAAGALRAAG